MKIIAVIIKKGNPILSQVLRQEGRQENKSSKEKIPLSPPSAFSHHFLLCTRYYLGAWNWLKCVAG